MELDIPDDEKEELRQFVLSMAKRKAAEYSKAIDGVLRSLQLNSPTYPNDLLPLLTSMERWGRIYLQIGGDLKALEQVVLFSNSREVITAKTISQ